MNYYEDDNKPNYAEISNSGKANQNRERASIIPVTANILKEAEVTKDDSVTYQGIPINDITIVGYIIDYKELESKIKLKICDFTGSVEVYFFNKMNEQDTTGLNKFNYDGTKKPAQIFGTLKVYKNEKNIQGEKILPVSCNNVLYHRTDVIHSWLYLTGKLNELKENQVQNSAQEAKMIAMENSTNYGYGYNNMKNTPIKNNGDKDLKEATNLLENYVKRYNRNEISYEQINNLLKKFGKKLGDIINKLVINNRLIDNDSGYEIM